ncbi:MAG: alpha/beta hydrolase fold domain-containing protein [Chloroflexi bacterium]|nr:alpha/beta hydrolase fold domain-containing protein [Chloroflexota bacterium]
MASPELDTVLQMIRKRGEEVRVTVDDFRLSYERIMATWPMDDDISTERIGAGGVPAEWIVAPGAQDGRVLLYLHGGGYIFGSTRTHRVMLAHISRAAQARVLGLDYRLAPECPFPAPVDDSVHERVAQAALDRVRSPLLTLDDLAPGATKAELTAAIEGHILAYGETMGKFQGPRQQGWYTDDSGSPIANTPTPVP